MIPDATATPSVFASEIVAVGVIPDATATPGTGVSSVGAAPVGSSGVQNAIGRMTGGDVEAFVGAAPPAPSAYDALARRSCSGDAVPSSRGYATRLCGLTPNASRPFASALISSAVSATFHAAASATSPVTPEK